MKKLVIIALVFLATHFLILGVVLGAWVVTKGDKTYIKDRTGELWDVTQAKSMGFIPRKFQYGIGRNAFTPLQDKDLNNNEFPRFSNERIIGVAVGNEAHAYSVKRLRYHEIANTTIGENPIAVGY